MPMFNQESFSKLSTCHQELQVLFFEVIKHVECEIIEGYRIDIHEHDGHEKHHHKPSLAVDVALAGAPNDKSVLVFMGIVLGIGAMLKSDGKITHEVVGVEMITEHDVLMAHFELVV